MKKEPRLVIYLIGKCLKTSAFIICTVIFLFFNSCYYDIEEELYPNSICDTSVTTFSAVINPIIKNNCTLSGCHVPGGSGIGNFTSYIGIKAAIDDGKFQNRVLVLQNMPPSGPLSKCDILKLETWISKGAQNN